MEEQIIWQGKSSQIVNLRAFIVYGVLLLILFSLSDNFGVLAAIGILFLLYRVAYQFLTVHLRDYTLTNERLVIAEGVFSKTTRDIELARIRDILLTEPIHLAFFGLGNLKIVSYQAMTSEFDLIAVSTPKALRENIRRLMAGATTRGAYWG